MPDVTTPSAALSRSRLTGALHPLAALLAATVLTLLGALAPTAALAHDHIVSSDPADGAHLTSAPRAITLTFSDTPLDVSPKVKVTAADGTVVAEGAPTIKDTAATFALPDTVPGGELTVDWRVVSADGHPIEGSFTFTVDSAATGAATATSTAASTSASTTPAATTATPTSNAAAPAASATPTAPASSGIGTGTLLVLLVPIVLIVALAAWLLLRRRR